MDNAMCQRGADLISDGKCRWLAAQHRITTSFLNFEFEFSCEAVGRDAAERP